MAGQTPEDAIRAYLDEHGGQDQVGLAELMLTWGWDEKNDAARAEVAAALRNVGVATDPPLEHARPGTQVRVHTQEPRDQAPTAALPPNPESPAPPSFTPTSTAPPGAQEAPGPPSRKGFFGWVSRKPKLALLGATLLALFIGTAIGLASTENEKKITELQDQVAALEEQRTSLEGQVAKEKQRARTAEKEAGERVDSVKERERDLRQKQEEQERALEEKSEQLDTRESDISSAEQELESSKIPDGIWQSGRDFAPGLYRSPGGDGCYWSKLGSADTSDIINNGGFTANQTLQIDSPFFETSDCGEWVKIG